MKKNTIRRNVLYRNKGVSARKTSQEHNNKDRSRLRYFSPGMRRNTGYTNFTKGVLRGCIVAGVYIGLTLHLLACQVRETVGDSIRSLLLCMCDVFRALINCLVSRFCGTGALGLDLVQLLAVIWIHPRLSQRWLGKTKLINSKLKVHVFISHWNDIRRFMTEEK